MDIQHCKSLSSLNGHPLERTPLYRKDTNLGSVHCGCMRLSVAPIDNTRHLEGGQTLFDRGVSLLLRGTTVLVSAVFVM